jgi:hypothetical protein
MAEPPNLPRARHEHSDVTIRFGIFWFGGITLALGLSIGICMGLFRDTLREALVPTPVPDYPAPTLQSTPRAQMAHFLRNELRWLNSLGWVDRAKGTVHMPIAEAMEKVAREGIKGWPKPPATHEAVR